MSKYADFAAKYGNYDVRSSDAADDAEERDDNVRRDLPRPFIPQPVPKGQIERRYAGPIDSPATIAFRHKVVEQAVINYKTRCPDSARSCAEAGATFRRRWEAARAAETEAAGATGGEETGGAQPEVGRDAGAAPEAEPEAARPPSLYTDDVAAAVNIEIKKCDCAECEEEAPPPYPRRRSARGAASGIRRADASVQYLRGQR